MRRGWLRVTWVLSGIRVRAILPQYFSCLRGGEGEGGGGKRREEEEDDDMEEEMEEEKMLEHQLG